jgi:hypothetical protein
MSTLNFQKPATALNTPIKPGDDVLVVIDTDRLWVAVTNVENNQVHGTINSDPAITSHGLVYRSPVTFTADCVHQVLND